MHPDKSTLQNLHLRLLVLWSRLRNKHGAWSMDNSDSLTQRLSSRQCTEQSTRKGVSDTVRIDNLFVLESVDSVRLDVIGTVGADNNVCTVSKHDNTIPGGVGLCGRGP